MSAPTQGVALGYHLAPRWGSEITPRALLSRRGSRPGRGRILAGMSNATKLPGIDFVLDGDGRQQAVVIDLRTHGELWEDIYDQLVTEQRRNEPRIPFAEARAVLGSSLDEMIGRTDV